MEQTILIVLIAIMFEMFERRRIEKLGTINVNFQKLSNEVIDLQKTIIRLRDEITNCDSRMGIVEAQQKQILEFFEVKGIPRGWITGKEALTERADYDMIGGV